MFPDKLFDRSGDMRVVAEELLHVAGHVVLSPYQNIGRYDRKRRCATTTPANILFSLNPEPGTNITRDSASVKVDNCRRPFECCGLFFI